MTDFECDGDVANAVNRRDVLKSIVGASAVGLLAPGSLSAQTTAPVPLAKDGLDGGGFGRVAGAQRQGPALARQGGGGAGRQPGAVDRPGGEDRPHAAILPRHHAEQPAIAIRHGGQRNRLAGTGRE